MSYSLVEPRERHPDLVSMVSLEDEVQVLMNAPAYTRALRPQRGDKDDDDDESEDALSLLLRTQGWRAYVRLTDVLNGSAKGMMYGSCLNFHHIRTRTHARTHSPLSLSHRSHTHTHTQPNTHSLSHTHTLTHHPPTHTHTHTKHTHTKHTHTHTRTHIHTYTHTNTHKHTTQPSRFTASL